MTNWNQHAQTLNSSDILFFSMPILFLVFMLNWNVQQMSKSKFACPQSGSYTIDDFGKN